MSTNVKLLVRKITAYSLSQIDYPKSAQPFPLIIAKTTLGIFLPSAKTRLSEVIYVFSCLFFGRSYVKSDTSLGVLPCRFYVAHGY